MNRASSSDTASTTMTTAGRGHQYLPVVPGMKSSGTNAMMFVMIANVTGLAMSRALDGRLELVHPLLAVLVDVLPHHDGVVHHNAQHHQEAEHRNHVDAEAHGGQE